MEFATRKSAMNVNLALTYAITLMTCDQSNKFEMKLMNNENSLHRNMNWSMNNMKKLETDYRRKPSQTTVEKRRKVTLFKFPQNPLSSKH